MSEKIAVLKEDSSLRHLFHDRVFVPIEDAKTYIDKKYLCYGAEYLEKHKAEGNIMYVQLVAYVIVINPKSGKIFIARRISGDNRLVDKVSIGFGGHVNSEDYDIINRCDFNDPVDHCAHRELREELSVKNKNLDLKPIGFVRDLASDTSEHLGVVYYLLTGSASVKEKDNMEGKWVDYDTFKENYYYELESWSKAIFDYIYEDKKLGKIFGLISKPESRGAKN